MCTVHVGIPLALYSRCTMCTAMMYKQNPSPTLVRAGKNSIHCQHPYVMTRQPPKWEQFKFPLSQNCIQHQGFLISRNQSDNFHPVSSWMYSSHSHRHAFFSFWCMVCLFLTRAQQICDLSYLGLFDNHFLLTMTNVRRCVASAPSACILAMVPYYALVT